MKYKNIGLTFLFVCIFLLGACGSGDDDDQITVTVTRAVRCAIPERVNTSVSPLTSSIPDNCGAEQITGKIYQTDQSVIHLAGISSETEPLPCPGGPFTYCLPFLPTGYAVGWENLDTGDAASGSRQFISALDRRVSWSTYKVEPAYLQTYATGIPLRMGSNEIQVTAGEFNSSGNAKITVTRVIDVTPPTVHRVLREPRTGTKIAIYFSEQIDPASLVDGIRVFDASDQLVPGTSEYDPLILKATWQPLSALNPGAFYTVRMSDITDWAPNTMIDSYEWSFTTQL